MGHLIVFHVLINSGWLFLPQCCQLPENRLTSYIIIFIITLISVRARTSNPQLTLWVFPMSWSSRRSDQILHQNWCYIISFYVIEPQNLINGHSKLLLQKKGFAECKDRLAFTAVTWVPISHLSHLSPFQTSSKDVCMNCVKQIIQSIVHVNITAQSSNNFCPIMLHYHKYDLTWHELRSNKIKKITKITWKTLLVLKQVFDPVFHSIELSISSKLTH